MHGFWLLSLKRWIVLGALTRCVLLQENKDEQWRRAMQYVSMVSELNYMAQVVIMLYEDPTKDPFSEARSEKYTSEEC